MARKKSGAVAVVEAPVAEVVAEVVTPVADVAEQGVAEVVGVTEAEGVGAEAVTTLHFAGTPAEVVAQLAEVFPPAEAETLAPAAPEGAAPEGAEAETPEETLAPAAPEGVAAPATEGAEAAAVTPAPVIPLGSLLVLALSEFPPNGARALASDEPTPEMIRSVTTYGVLQPVVVVQTPDGVRTLAAGRRRVKAARAAGLREIPAVVFAAEAVDATILAACVSVAENTFRSKNDKSNLQAILAMEKAKMTTKEIAARLGLTEAQVGQRRRLGDLPGPVLEYVLSGNVPDNVANELRGLPTAQQLEVLASWKKGGTSGKISIRDIRKMKQARKAADAAEGASGPAEAYEEFAPPPPRAESAEVPWPQMVRNLVNGASGFVKAANTLALAHRADALCDAFELIHEQLEKAYDALEGMGEDEPMPPSPRGGTGKKKARAVHVVHVAEEQGAAEAAPQGPALLTAAPQGPAPEEAVVGTEESPGEEAVVGAEEAGVVVGTVVYTGDPAEEAEASVVEEAEASVVEEAEASVVEEAEASVVEEGPVDAAPVAEEVVPEVLTAPDPDALDDAPADTL